MGKSAEIEDSGSGPFTAMISQPICPPSDRLVEIHRGGEHVLYCDGAAHWSYYWGEHHFDAKCHNQGGCKP